MLVLCYCGLARYSTVIFLCCVNGSRAHNLHIGKIPCTVLVSWRGCLACILWQCDIFLFCQFYSLQHILQMAPENIVKVCKMLLFPDLRTIFIDLELAGWIVKKTKATGQNYCSSKCHLGSIKINHFAQCFSKRKN